MNTSFMKNKLNITHLFCILALTSTLIACGNSEKKGTTAKDSAAPVNTTKETPTNSTTEKFEEFDWNTVPISTADIGIFPYLSAPDGFFIQDKGGYDESKTGYSDLKDFNKLIMFTGKSFYNAEGKVARLKFSMKDKEAEWNQYKFDTYIEKQLNSIGAKLLAKLKINQAQKDFLNKDDDMTIYNHMVADPYNEPARFYALNHEKGKIMFQISSNSAMGEVAVVELVKK